MNARRRVSGAGALAATMSFAVPACALAAQPGQAAPGLAPAAVPAVTPAAAPAVAAVSRAKQGRVIEVRPTDVRLLTDGVPTVVRPRAAGPLTLTELARLVGDSGRLAIRGHGRSRVATLAATIYQAPGTTLTIGAADAATLRLLTHPTGLGGCLFGSGATLSVQGVHVTGWAGRGPAAPGAHRAYVAYTKGSTVRLTDSVFTYLGRPQEGREGVAVTGGAGLLALRSRFEHNRSGLAAVRTTNTVLQNVSASANQTTGVVVRGASGARLAGVVATHNQGPGLKIDASTGTRASALKLVANGQNGMSVRNSTATVLTDVTATGNGYAQAPAATGAKAAKRAATKGRSPDGVELSRDTDVRLTRVTTSGNAGAGLDVAASRRVQGATVTGSRDDVGVTVRAGSTGVALDGVRVAQAGTAGLRLAGQGVSAKHVDVSGTATGLLLPGDGQGTRVDAAHIASPQVGVRVVGGNTGSALNGVTVEGAGVNGVDLAGRGTRVSALTVRGGHTAAVVRAGAGDVDLSGVTASGVGTGLRVQPKAGAVAVHDLAVDGGSWGIDAEAGALTVTGGRLSGVTNGAKLTAGDALDGVTVEAADCGVRAIGGAPRIEGGSVRAQRAQCGDVAMADTEVLPPTDPRGLGIFAGCMVVLAAGFEVVRRAREGRRPQRRASGSEGAPA